MKWILVIIVLLALLLLVIIKAKRQIIVKLNKAIHEENWLTFNTLINKWYTNLIINHTTITNLKLKVAMAKKDLPTLTVLFEQLEATTNNNKQQLADLYLQGFNYYVSIEDEQAALIFLHKIKSIDNQAMSLEATRVFNICIKKSDEDLETLLAELPNLDDQQKGTNEFLISLIYKNKNDYQKQDEYIKLSKKHLSLK